MLALRTVTYCTENEETPVKTTWAQAATNTGFKFQRSDTLSPSSVGLPATFGYASSQKDGSDRSSSFQAEFAFVWESPSVLPSGFAPRASLEAQLNSSGDKKANDLVRARIGASKMLHGSSEGTGIELTTNLKYETERKTGTKKGLIEVVATPIYGVLGTYWPGPPKPSQATQSLNYRVLPSIQIAPLLKFGAEIGKAFDTGTSTETGDTLVRYKTIGRLDTEFNFLASALSLRNVTGYLEATYWRLPRETKKSHHLAKTGLSFGLSDEISIDLSYSVGRDSPSFKFARSGIVGLGIKF